MNVTVIRPEPTIRISRPAGHTNYTLAGAKALRDELTAAIREVEGLDKEAPSLRIGARVRRTKGTWSPGSRYSAGLEGTITGLSDVYAEVNTAKGPVAWSVGDFEVIG